MATEQKSGIDLIYGVLACMASLPLCEAWKLQNINFLACSNKLTAMEMSHSLVDELLKLEQGIIVYDSFFKCEVLVIAPVICILCDNARASEIVNHLGARAIRYCRKCMVSQC